MKEIAINLGGQDFNPTFAPRGGLPEMQIFIRNSLMIFLVFGAFFIVIYIILAGIQWIMSGGDKNKLAAARAKLTWAIIGFIVILSSFFIINGIGYLFKVDLLKLI
ncbi:hypothetical protein HZA75_03310 [Candidatus Roizmanbacteria bacterium]|nr:hypothetical protein [Candidatus Roizmanbacteria bacterium]